MSRFSSLSILTLDDSWDGALSVASLEAALAHAPFRPCEPLQTLSVGFVPPRGPHNALVESVNGELIFQVELEQKNVPGAAVKAKLEERVAAVEAQFGRKPGRKEKAELKEEIIQELLPHAFPKRSRATAWLSRSLKLVVIGSTSSSVADSLTTVLLSCLEKEGTTLPLRMVNTVQSPSTTMTNWLLADPESVEQLFADFELGREVELKDDESKASVRYSNHVLPTDEVRGHIQNGKRPTRLALTWSGNVQFMLTESMGLKKVTILGVEAQSEADVAADAFDADLALETGELSKLLPALIAAHGGLLCPETPSTEA